MATPKTNSLHIKNFKGRDAYVEGTSQDQEVFEIVQNYYSPNPGELRNIDGVIKKNQAPIAGISSIVYGKFLDTPKDKGIVLICKPDRTGPAAPTGWTTSTSGGSAANWDVYIEYITPGSGHRGALLASTSIEANGLTLTTPSGISDEVRCVVFWAGAVGASGNDLIRVAYMYRKSDGTFPSSITIFPNSAVVSSGFSYTYKPGSFSCSPGTSGILEGGRTYYLGLSVFSRSQESPVEVSFTDAAGTPLSYYLPEGYSSINFVFKHCPFNAVNDISGPPISSEFTMNRVMVFFGVSPTDMVAAPVQEGTCISYEKSTGTATTNHSNLTNEYETTTENFNVGTLLKMTNTTVSGAACGLTANSYYYVKSSTPFGVDGCKFTVSATPDGAVINPTGVGSSQWSFGTVIGTIRDVGHSIPISVFEARKDTETKKLKPTAANGRNFGFYSPVQDYPSIVGRTDPYMYHGVYFSSDDFTDAVRRDLFVSHQAPCLDLQRYNEYLENQYFFVDYTWLGIRESNDYEWQSRQYGNRLWFVNGFNEPMYTNGYVWRMAVPSNTIGSDAEQRWPITKYIEFYKDMMVLASDSGNVTYNEGYVYYSNNTAGASDIQYFNKSGTTLRAVSVNNGDQSQVTCLNIYSQDLTSVGAETFLVIGKKSAVNVWDGTSGATKQISRVTGIAGPNAYSLTIYGPVFVGRDNVWLFRTSTDIVSIGDPVKDIIKSLSNDNLYSVNCIYHDEELKIGYTDSLPNDREIWCRLSQVQGGLNRVWTGPHIMKNYVGQSVILDWNNDKNYRLSFDSENLYRRDDPFSTSNDGYDQVRVLKIRNLSLGVDPLLKVVHGVDLHLGTVEDESFDVTLQSEDGSQSIVVEVDDTFNGANRHYKNIQIPQRFLARVLTLTLENTNNSPLSIYDLSIYFQVMRRKLLP